MNTASLKLGQRVKFVGWFTENGRPFDPETVTVTVATHNGITVYTSANGVAHDNTGQYSLILTLTTLGRTVLQFTGDKIFSEQIYQVERENPLIVQHAGSLMAPRSAAHDLKLDELSRRASMIDSLNERGIRVDPDRSTAYITAAYDQMMRRFR